MVLPSLPEQEPLLWILDLALLLGAGGLVSLAIFTSLSKALLIPIKDPYLIESLPDACKCQEHL